MSEHLAELQKRIDSLLRENHELKQQLVIKDQIIRRQGVLLANQEADNVARA